MGFAEWEIPPQSQANREPKPGQTTKKQAQNEPGSHPKNEAPSSLPTDQPTTPPEVPLCATSLWTDRPDECHEHAIVTHSVTKADANSGE